MSEKRFYFIIDGTQLALPVTPSRYSWEQGKSIETVNISELGDVALAGKPQRYSGSIECLFPANSYPWLAPGAGTDPWYYVGVFSRLALSEQPVRYIVGGAEINAQVLVESITYEEKDASGDVYATLRLREWTDVEAVTVSNLDAAAGTGGTQNGSQTQSGGSQQYTIVSGDMLSVLCRRFYGNGSATYYNALAAYNGISNPHLIYPGTTITVPPVSELLGG